MGVSLAQQLSGSYYPQGGVQFLHKDYCDHYNKWMVEKIKSTYMPIMFGDYEQSYIFEYTSQFPQNITWLDYKYNCVPSKTILRRGMSKLLFNTFARF